MHNDAVSNVLEILIDVGDVFENLTKFVAIPHHRSSWTRLVLR